MIRRAYPEEITEDSPSVFTSNCGLNGYPAPTELFKRQRNLYGLSVRPTSQILEEWINKCLQGSRKHQRLLFETFYSDGMNIASRYSRNEEEAKEILSNAFIRVFKKLVSFNTSLPFMPWFKTIIIHCSSDYYRYDHHIIKDEIGNSGIDVPEISGVVDQLQYEDILQLVQQLPDIQRAVFNLHEIEGYKHGEIADLLGIMEGTSKSCLSRAKATLRQLIEQLYE